MALQEKRSIELHDSVGLRHIHGAHLDARQAVARTKNDDDRGDRP